MHWRKSSPRVYSPVAATDPHSPQSIFPTAHDTNKSQNHDCDENSDIVHYSAQTAPQVSPKVAAIEARTFAAAQVQTNEVEEDKNLLPDRPEKRRTQRGPGAVLARKASVSSSSDQPSDGSESANPTSPFGISGNWLINYNDILIGKTIGHSSFGQVNEGKLNGTKVAIKTIQRDSKAKGGDLSAFAKEAELNCKLRHPNIVLFMGISIQLKKVCIVTELMARGNVRDLLVAGPKDKFVKLDWSLRLQWALDTAQGMAYLHSLNPPMIHRDLKTTNLLVDRGMNVKICDFGLSRFRVEDKVMSAVGTVQFAAPEVLRHERYTEKADLFSFGTVLWELYTRERVFHGLPQIQVYKSVVEGTMPNVGPACDERYQQLMKECWALDPTDRPSFRQVIDRVSELVEELEEIGEN